MNGKHGCIASWVVALGAVGLLACSQKGRAAPAEPQPAATKAAGAVEAEKTSQPTLAASSNAGAQAAELGKPAPLFTLADIDGTQHELGKLKGKTVVLEWFNPECPFVRHAHTKGPLHDQAARVQSPNVVWLSINSGALGKQGNGLERNRSGKTEYGISNPILLDESGAVGRAYGAIKTPHLFIVDAKGVLVYRGGIDNAPIGTVDDARPRLPDSKPGQVVNYVDAALQDIALGRPLRLPDTPPYGCSVKYSS